MLHMSFVEMWFSVIPHYSIKDIPVLNILVGIYSLYTSLYNNWGSNHWPHWNKQWNGITAFWYCKWLKSNCSASTDQIQEIKHESERDDQELYSGYWEYKNWIRLEQEQNELIYLSPCAMHQKSEIKFLHKDWTDWQDETWTWKVWFRTLLRNLEHKNPIRIERERTY